MDPFGFILDIQAFHALILAVGIILVVVEMFHPGFGAPGIIGGILIAVGIFLTAESIAQALILVFLILVILAIALVFVVRSAKSGRLSKILILSNSQSKEAGYTGNTNLEGYLGKEGIAVTVLRPSGTVEFDGVKVDVVTEGEFINPGKKVKVIKVEGVKVVVR